MSEGWKHNYLNCCSNLFFSRQLLFRYVSSVVPQPQKANVCSFFLPSLIGQMCNLQEKGSLASGSYSATGKTSARSDLSPVFGKFLEFFCIRRLSVTLSFGFAPLPEEKFTAGFRDTIFCRGFHIFSLFFIEAGHFFFPLLFPRLVIWESSSLGHGFSWKRQKCELWRGFELVGCKGYSK